VTRPRPPGPGIARGALAAVAAVALATTGGLLAGCGRLGFDALVAGDDVLAPDAPPGTPVVGVLDPTFNAGVVVTYNYVDNDATAKDDRATAVAIDSAGRIVVSASGTYNYYASDDQLDMAAISIRLTPGGAFDPTYQDGPLSSPGVTVNTGGPWAHGTGLLVDASDRVIVCGYREWGGTDDPTFLRYLPVAGQPDPAWGTAGVSSVSIAGEAECFACTRDPTDGDYVVAGGTSTGAMLVAKIHAADGSVDPTFAGTGSLIYDVPGTDHAAAVLVDSAGLIYAVGTTGGPADDVAVWRYQPGGTLDPAFSTDGIFHLDAGDVDIASGAALDAAENLVVVGYRNIPGGASLDHDAVVMRIDRVTGELDPTFGTGGVTVLGAHNVVEEAHGVTIDPTGAIWVTGSAPIVTTSQVGMAIWKLTSAGALDPTFGGTGLSTTPGLFLTTVGPARNDTGWAITRDAAGRLVVAGETLPNGGFSDAAIWRIR